MTCSGPLANQCLSCADPTVRSLVGGVCACNKGTIEIGGGVCAPCHANCAECDGLTEDDCIACRNLDHRELFNGRCICQPRYRDGSGVPC